MHSLVVFPLLVCLLSGCSTKPVQRQNFDLISPTAEQGISLLKTMQEGLSGQDGSSELQARFDAYSRFAKMVKPYEACVAELADNPFCELREADKRSRSDRAARTPKKEVRRLASLMRKGELQQLRRAPAASIRQAFKSLGKSASFERHTKRLGEALLALEGDCDLASLNLLLGARAEESSPDPSAIEKAIAHYDRAGKCATAQDGEKALYRVALLQYWRGKPEVAAESLRRLIEVPNGEFRARSLFWMQQLHHEIGKTAEAETYRTMLKTEFPFSLHNLIAESRYPGEKTARELPQDTRILLRSESRPELNPRVTAVEFLLGRSQNRQASRLLGSIISRMEGSEPQFQLYLAVLYHRSGDYLGKFRVLSALLKDSPQLVSKPTLELYYPKKSAVAANNLKLAEFLVLSLIRQESAFNEQARSPAGAIGLMQVMPSTARLIDRKARRASLFDVDRNLRIGTEYFSRLLHRFDGDAELALAAYNAGPGRVEEWVQRYPVKDRLLFLDLIPFKETREYVAAITRNYYWYTSLYGGPNTEPAAKKPGARDYVFRLLAAKS